MSPLDEAIIANDQLPEQQRESNVKLGARFGVSEAAVRRHRRAIRRRNNQADTQTDAFFGVPTQAITSRGKTIRLEDGSYEKITYIPGAAEREEAKRLSYQDLAPILAQPLTKPGWRPAGPPLSPLSSPTSNSARPAAGAAPLTHSAGSTTSSPRSPTTAHATATKRSSS